MTDKDTLFFSEVLPHTHALLQRITNDDALNSPKQLISAITQKYSGLTRLEKCSAARMLSESARVAAPVTDERLCRLFDEAFEHYRSHSPKPVPRPRIIVAASDFANASAGYFPGSAQPSLIISQALLDALDDKGVKASLYHEFSHMERDLIPSYFSTFIATPTKHLLTRNASRRRIELAADTLSVRLSDNPELVEHVLKTLDEHNACATQVLIQIAQNNMAEFSGVGGKKLAIANWIIEKILGEVMEKLHDGSSPPEMSWHTKAIKAPRYPTLGERLDNIRKSGSSGGAERHL